MSESTKPTFSPIYEQHDIDTLNNNFYYQLEDAVTNENERCMALTHKNLIHFGCENVPFIMGRAQLFFKQDVNQCILSLQSLHPFQVKIKANISNTTNRLSILSQREKECLFHLLQGKSYKSTAKLMQISPRTAEQYINNVKMKWLCTYKEDIFKKAIEYGYLNIFPMQ